MLLNFVDANNDVTDLAKPTLRNSKADNACINSLFLAAVIIQYPFVSLQLDFIDIGLRTVCQRSRCSVFVRCFGVAEYNCFLHCSTHQCVQFFLIHEELLHYDCGFLNSRLRSKYLRYWIRRNADISVNWLMWLCCCCSQLTCGQLFSHCHYCQWSMPTGRLNGRWLKWRQLSGCLPNSWQVTALTNFSSLQETSFRLPSETTCWYACLMASLFVIC